MPSYQREFPSFPTLGEAAELRAIGFEDQSWHNDACPRFERADIIVWIEHPDEELRDCPERYCVCRRIGDHSEDELIYAGDSWADALQAIPLT